MAYVRQYLAKLAPAVLVGGCSLIYNPSNIGKPPADAIDAPPDMMEMMMIDAAIDAPPIMDADPTMLVLEKVAPATIYEGQGIDGARKAVVVVRGHHILPSATVTVAPLTGLTVDPPVFSSNGDFILLTMAVAIDTGRADTEALTISVDQAGTTTKMVTGLTVQYLPELDTGTTINGDTLEDLYSQVDLGAVTFTGTEAVKIRAVSSITIGNIDVAGKNAMGGTPGAAGPGGCAGGDSSQNGGCQGYEGGGFGGAGGNGGGGGGFGAMGTAGASGGAGGAVHGNPQLVNYVVNGNGPLTNRSGGGGGGGAQGAGSGGTGGGGGGTIELNAGGNITTGSIDADGGNGSNGTATVVAVDKGGGGGGGSGGAIVIKSAAGTIMNTGAITASFGTPGNSGAAGGTQGGAGGVGRIRIDSPVAAPPSTSPTAHRGPTYAVATPLYVTVVKPTISMFGQNGDNIDGFVIDMDNQLRLGEPVDQVFANGTVSVMPTLIAGYNKLCFTLEPAVRPMTAVTDPLADSCIEIAYLP